MIIEAKVELKFGSEEEEIYVVEGNVETGEDLRELVYKLIEQFYDRYKWGFSMELISIQEDDGLYWPYIHFEDADTQESFKVYLTKKEVV